MRAAAFALAAFAMVACAHPGGNVTATLEANKESSRQFVERVWNQGDLAAIDELFAPQFVNHTPTNPNETREQLKERIAAMRAAFSGVRLEVNDLVAEGDRVATRFTLIGTHTAEFRGIAATGKTVRVSGFAIDRFADGKRVEGWVLLDAASLMAQLR